VAQTAPALSAEQAAKVQKIQSERYAEAAKVRGEMTAKRIELQGLYRAPELDKAKIAAKQKELSELQARNREKAQASRLAFLEVLTPEQRAQLPAQGFGHGRGRGMGPGGRW
jgi:Spy/CpxP family protein refolding chaperone